MSTASNVNSSAPPPGHEEADAYRLIQPRTPQKRDDSKPSLNSLGTELILIIFNMVCSDSPRSIKNLALVSSHYHYAARYCQHREIGLDISEARKEALQRRLAYIEQGGFLPAVRRINVRGEENDQENLEAVGQFLEKATGLKDLEWLNKGPPVSSIGVPEQVLAALQSRTTVRLHTSVKPSFRHWRSASPPRYTAPLLRGSENLHSLRMCFTYTELDTCIEMARVVKCILLSSPNVRKLAIDVGYPTMGCVMYGPPSRYTGLGFVDGERPSALEELELGGYDFGWHEPEDRQDSRFGGSYVGYPGTGRETEYWAETFDWSRLRHLQTDQPSFALQLAPKLVALEEASLGPSSNSKTIREFYDTVPNPLSTLKILQFDALGVEGIIRHAPKLKVLHIHQKQSRNWAEHTIDAPSLLKIREECPLIEELVLDIGREGDWPYEMLDILAGFTKLRSLTIWFELGWVGREPCDVVQPPVTYSAVEKIFMYLRLTRPSIFQPLKELKVYCGCPRPIRGYPAPQGLWPPRNKSSYVCRLSERDDEAPSGVFSISCPGLTEDENALLSKTRGDHGEEPVDPSRAVKVALHGPIAFSKYRYDL